MTMTSQASASWCSCRSAVRVGEPDSSSPSTNSVTPTGGPAAVGAQDREVGHDAGLVVGGAAAVEPAVALGGLERRAGPQLVAARRLDVVVGVEQHGRARRAARASGRSPPGRRPRRRRSGRRAPASRRQRGDGLGAAPGVVGVRGVGPDARDADEAFEVGPRPRQDVGHRGGEVGISGGPHPHGAGPARAAPMLVGRGGRAVGSMRRTQGSTSAGSAGFAVRRARRFGVARHVPVPHDVAGHRRRLTPRHDDRGTAHPRPTVLARDPRDRPAGRGCTDGGRASGGARPSACWPASRPRSPRPRRPSGSSAAA